MRHTILATIEAERARTAHRLGDAEAELKRLQGAPIPAMDGDEEGGMGVRVERARQLDMAELELERARAAHEAVKVLADRVDRAVADADPKPTDLLGTIRPDRAGHL